MRERMEPFRETIDILLMVLSYIFSEKDKARVHKLNLEKSRGLNKMFNQMRLILWLDYLKINYIK
jgi:hypothetical protein